MSRCPEIDAMRGILLVIMALTHLPTGLNVYADQPLGYVSAAEGFVFLSAFLLGSRYSSLLLDRGVAYVRRTLWRRAAKLYGFHLGLLLFAFTIVAGVAVLSHNVALHNHLLFFFRAPGWAALSAVLLLYQPPLLDILPMYIVFLALTPLLLQFALRYGWRLPLIASGLLWLCAQLHADGWLYAAVRTSGLPLPRDAWSAFDWLAWQLVWMGGVWLGAQGQRRSVAAGVAPAGVTSAVAPPGVARGSARAWLLAAACAVTVVLLCSRRHFGGFPLQLDVNSWVVNKWTLGPLRVVNFAALGLLVSRTLLPGLHLLRVAALELLGRASLQVFTAHIPVCILADGLVTAAVPVLPVPHQVLLLALMFSVMLLVAWRTDAPRRRAAQAAALALAAAGAGLNAEA